MEEEDDEKALQLLPTPLNPIPTSTQNPTWVSESSGRPHSIPSDTYGGQSLDLQLSISLDPIKPPSDCVPPGIPRESDLRCAEAMRWQAAEQIRLATIEKAYVERVRELTRREMELAQSEFAQARYLRDRARHEVEKAERMKETATRQVDSRYMEVTCHACRKQFRP